MIVLYNEVYILQCNFSYTVVHLPPTQLNFSYMLLILGVYSYLAIKVSALLGSHNL